MPIQLNKTARKTHYSTNTQPKLAGDNKLLVHIQIHWNVYDNLTSTSIWQSEPDLFNPSAVCQWHINILHMTQRQCHVPEKQVMFKMIPLDNSQGYHTCGQAASLTIWSTTSPTQTPTYTHTHTHTHLLNNIILITILDISLLTDGGLPSILC